MPDADRPSITAFALAGKKYEEVALVAGDELFEPDRPYAVSIVPRLLVADGRERRSLLR